MGRWHEAPRGAVSGGCTRPLPRPAPPVAHTCSRHLLPSPRQSLPGCWGHLAPLGPSLGLPRPQGQPGDTAATGGLPGRPKCSSGARPGPAKGVNWRGGGRKGNSPPRDCSHSSHSRRGKGRVDVHPGCPRDRGGGPPSGPACRRRVGVHLSGHPGEESGERDRTGDTRPRWEGLLWTAPPETQIAQEQGPGCRGATLHCRPPDPPGCTRVPGLIADVTRDTPHWAGIHQWPRHEIIYVCVYVCTCA